MPDEFNIHQAIAGGVRELLLDFTGRAAQVRNNRQIKRTGWITPQRLVADVLLVEAFKPRQIEIENRGAALYAERGV